MKSFLIFIILFITLCFNLGCLKDELNISSNSKKEEIVEERTGFRDVIFYKKSLTSDNALLAYSDSQILRKYHIFNKAKILNIEFESTDKGVVNFNGIVLKHYNIKVNFIDSSSYKLTAFSTPVGNYSILNPSNDNTLINQHSANFIEIINTGVKRNSPTYNLWRDQREKVDVWQIKKDGLYLMDIRPLEPLDKNNIIFIPNHIH